MKITLQLISPDDEKQLWIARGLPQSRRVGGNGEFEKTLGVDITTDTPLWLVGNNHACDCPASEIVALAETLYDERQINSNLFNGDEIIIPETEVREHHSYRVDAPTFIIPAHRYVVQDEHIVPADNDTKALLASAVHTLTQVLSHA